VKRPAASGPDSDVVVCTGDRVLRDLTGEEHAHA
jgi:hypothetical protein